jgi:hypothetical protein
MKFHERSIPHRDVWAYGYELVPPIARHRTRTIDALLDDGHAKARLARHTWEARLINGDDITHILVVSDRPDQDLEVNQLLEAELNRLGAPFAITPAVAIRGDSGSGFLPEPMGNA